MAHRDRPGVTAGINLLDCDDCKARKPKEQRQMFGCGYEVPIEKSKPWAPSGYLELTEGKRPATCIGYTRTLPLAQDITWDAYHWDQGSLGLVYPDAVTDEQWDLMKRFKSGQGGAQKWALDNPVKKPGPP